jgi:predicted 3-demethylubiquinone-9 3-methyltransferase (glyoxalase superfamily)
MQKITPHLWFDTEAEEAAALYTSIFNEGKITSSTRYSEAGFEIHKMKAGTVMTIAFEIEGYKFLGLNAGPIFKFTPAISFIVNCPTKEEVDVLWNALIDGGSSLMELGAYPFSERYGWVKDKFGVTWQIIHNPQVSKRTIMPSLMYAGDQAGKAEEAINLYTGVFENSSIGTIARYGAENAPDKEGTIMYADFTLEGQKFAAMDSAQAHDFTFNEAVSLLVSCKDQAEIDYFWNALSAVPEAEQCGWIKDKYGVSWQIVPGGMEKMFNEGDGEKAKRAMDAMLKMKKIDIAKLNEAYEG